MLDERYQTVVEARTRRPEAIPVCATCDVPWSGSYSGATPLAKAKNFFFSAVWAR